MPPFCLQHGGVIELRSGVLKAFCRRLTYWLVEGLLNVKPFPEERNHGETV